MFCTLVSGREKVGFSNDVFLGSGTFGTVEVVDSEYNDSSSTIDALCRTDCVWYEGGPVMNEFIKYAGILFRYATGGGEVGRASSSIRI